MIYLWSLLDKKYMIYDVKLGINIMIGMQTKFLKNLWFKIAPHFVK